MKYLFSRYWTDKAKEIAQQLDMTHIKPDRVACIESHGTKTKRTVARIHGLSKAIQLGMETDAFYVIELIAEQFHKESEEEKIQTIIHELMHIPASFGGGFRHHRPYVTKAKVRKQYQKYLAKQNP
jgi:predicted metallopeptidase